MHLYFFRSYYLRKHVSLYFQKQEATSLLLTALFVLGQASGSFASFFLIESL